MSLAKFLGFLPNLDKDAQAAAWIGRLIAPSYTIYRHTREDTKQNKAGKSSQATCSLPSHQFASCTACASLAERLLDRKSLLTTVLEELDDAP